MTTREEVTTGEEAEGSQHAELAEARYLRTPRAIREKAEEIYGRCLAGELEHFALDESRLPAVVERVVAVTRATYPDVNQIPEHTRFRHFGVGGLDRVAALEARLGDVSAEERLCVKLELAITSVLLDAGAGTLWSYQEPVPGGQRYARSEGLAVASYHLYLQGGFSDDPLHAPLRADAQALSHFGEDALAAAFQSRPDNPLVGLSGRAEVLRRLGEVVERRKEIFGARLGQIGLHLLSLSRGGALPAATVLEVVLDALGDIWPGREICGGQNLGDVWPHPTFGRVPFHKLSQWLTYSLCEPLAAYGLAIIDKDDLTGLAEYRNGGLFLDGGVLVPKHPTVLTSTHDVSSPVIIEWRALTVALLDLTALAMRESLGLSAEALPLARVLEGGTWRAGRELARERRADGSPPLHVHSDGTVF